MSESRWDRLAERPSGAAYDRDLQAQAASGKDMHGEASFVDAELGGPCRVLDAGCGTGRVAIRLADLGYDVVGVDLDESMLDVARGNAPQLDWRHGDLATVEVPGVFDGVVCAGNVIPLLAEGALAGTMRNLRSTLRDGGVLIAGFGLDRAHLPRGCEPTPLSDYLAACRAAGFAHVASYATWDRAPYADAGGYAVVVHRAENPSD